MQESVLILIIMEDTHREEYRSSLRRCSLVLILMIMEDTHGDLCEFLRVVDTES